MTVLPMVAEKSKIFSSKGEARRMIQNNGVFVNKDKFESETEKISTAHLLNGKYILIQKGMKNYFVIVVV